MHFSPPSLHPPVVQSDAHKAEATAQLSSIATARPQLIERAAPAPPTGASFAIPLTTVSVNGNFDAYINISFPGQPAGASTRLVVDSGNSNLIVPSWEAIAAIPNWQQSYTVLGQANEPWGSPANVVRGPIQIPTAGGGMYRIDDCVFYACTGGNRTANFGAGCITPWSVNGWNDPISGVVMQAPLSYNTAYPYAEFNYAAASSVFHAAGALLVSAAGSSLVMYASQPPGYAMFDTIPNLEWMSLIPKSLQIGTVQTQWPGSVTSPIAMVDTGGGPVFLSDPNQYVCNGQWPDPATCPTWTSASQSCKCISGNITIQLGDSGSATSYTIDTSTLPWSVRGLTLVMCQVNQFMMGQQGMNIGGLSALFQYILVDYANGQVGFKTK